MWLLHRLRYIVSRRPPMQIDPIYTPHRLAKSSEISRRLDAMVEKCPGKM